MIDALHHALTEARGPDRLLDCLLHECLLGELDEQLVDNGRYGTRDGNRAHGEMLIDKGAERLRIRVPTYTNSFDEAAKLLDPELALRVTYTPPKIRANPLFKEAGFKSWIMSFHDPRTGSIGAIAEATHDASAALCLCLLAVSYRIKK